MLMECTKYRNSIIWNFAKQLCKVGDFATLQLCGLCKTTLRKGGRLEKYNNIIYIYLYNIYILYKVNTPLVALTLQFCTFSFAMFAKSAKFQFCKVHEINIKKVQINSFI